MNYCAGVQAADDKRIYWTTQQSCKNDNNYPASLEWWSIRTISKSDYEKVMDWAQSVSFSEFGIKYCAAINALNGNPIHWTTHQTCEHYNNDILASLEWWSISQITESDYARVVRSAPSFTTSSTVTTFTGYCFRPKDEYFYQSLYLEKCVGSDWNITKQEFDNRRLASSTTASPLVDTYCYNYDLHGDYYWKSVSGSCGSWINISKQEYDNRQLSSTTATLRITSNHPGATIQVDGKYSGVTPTIIKVDKGSHTVKVSKVGYEGWATTINVTANRSIRASTVALSYSNNPLGYCYYPPTQIFYIQVGAECASGDLEITKQEFKNKTVVSATFRFLDSHWYRAPCLGNVEFPCRFTYENRTNKNIRIVIQTKQGEIIFPDGSTLYRHIR